MFFLKGDCHVLMISPMSYQILADIVPSALPALTLPIHTHVPGHDYSGGC